VKQCVAACNASSVLQSVVEYRRVLQCVAVCCSVLQCVAVCCSVLQSVVEYRRVLQYNTLCYTDFVRHAAAKVRHTAMSS